MSINLGQADEKHAATPQNLHYMDCLGFAVPLGRFQQLNRRGYRYTCRTQLEFHTKYTTEDCEYF